MANALIAAVSGLSAFQSMLQVVGNNLSNQTTVGFKSQTTRFSDLVYQTLRAASGSTTAGVVGGTNPVQVGFGTNLAGIDVDLTQGRLEADGNSLHLGLEGQGFFVLNDGAGDLFSRAGPFDVDVSNFLVDPGTGFKVRRFGNVGEGGGTNPAFQTPGDNNIKIPFGTGIPAAATQNVTLQGNLSASATAAQANVLTSAAPYTRVAPPGPADAATTLNNLTQTTALYTGGETINIVGTRTNGTAFTTTLAAGPATDMAALLTALNAPAAFDSLSPTGATASIVAGNLVVTANSTGPGALSLGLSNGPGGTGITNWSSMATTVPGKTADSVTTAIPIFDVRGVSHPLTLTFAKATGFNQWTLTGSVPAAEGTLTGSATITFNNNGSLQLFSVTTPFTATFGALPPQSIAFQPGTVSQFNGLTQFGGQSSAGATSQDGFAAGILANVSVDVDGIIKGVFTNGKVLSLAQLAVAMFTQPHGLDRVGNNVNKPTAQSGVPQISSAGAGGRGLIRPGTLEQSNVDVATELTRLVVAQRGFQINARAIRVANDTLDEAANIIR